MVRAKVSSAPKTASADIDAFIEGGLAAPVAAEPAPESDAKFTLRYPADLKRRIEAAIKQLPGKVSLNTWLITAAMEKLDREGR